MKNLLKLTLIFASLGFVSNCGGADQFATDPNIDPVPHYCLSTGLASEDSNAVVYSGCALPSPDLEVIYYLYTENETVWSLYVIYDETHGWLIGNSENTYYAMSDEDTAALLEYTGSSVFSDFLTNCDTETIGDESYDYHIWSNKLGMSEGDHSCLDDNENTAFVDFLTEVADRTIP